MSIVCPSHPEAEMVEDLSSGDLSCTRCGLVVGESSERTWNNDPPVEFCSAVGSTNKWGKSQQRYYGTSYVDKDFGGVNDSEEEEMLQLEEEDAKARQKKIESANSLVDFECLIGFSMEKNNGASELFEVFNVMHALTKDAGEKSKGNGAGATEQNLLDLRSETATDVEHLNNGRQCITIEKRRKINYEIRKNKGIRKDKGRRKAKQRHARVMKRTQYEKALIKRKSQVPNMRREMERYNGEKRGIRVSTIRSIKL